MKFASRRRMRILAVCFMVFCCSLCSYCEEGNLIEQGKQKWHINTWEDAFELLQSKLMESQSAACKEKWSKVSGALLADKFADAVELIKSGKLIDACTGDAKQVVHLLLLTLSSMDRELYLIQMELASKPNEKLQKVNSLLSAAVAEKRYQDAKTLIESNEAVISESADLKARFNNLKAALTLAIRRK
jgi:hypothetical protein